MTDSERIEWISNAAYAELFSKWRFEPLGSPWFQGEVGAHFARRLSDLSSEISAEERVNQSKRLGWTR